MKQFQTLYKKIYILMRDTMYTSNKGKWLIIENRRLKQVCMICVLFVMGIVVSLWLLICHTYGVWCLNTELNWLSFHLTMNVPILVFFFHCCSFLIHSVITFNASIWFLYSIGSVVHCLGTIFFQWRWKFCAVSWIWCSKF